jgi:hypothetical protein
MDKNKDDTEGKICLESIFDRKKENKKKWITIAFKSIINIIVYSIKK